MTKEILQKYKVCVLDENGMPKYYLLFGYDDTKIQKNHFSQLELEYIKEKQIQYFFCNSNSDSILIHSDDSVKILKQKIIRQFQQLELPSVVEHDMYLFATTFKSFQPLPIYKRLTKQDSIPLTKSMLDQFIMNYYGLDPKEPDFLHHPLYETKNEFIYEDLLEFEWFYNANTNNIKAKKIPLGFRFIENKKKDDNLYYNQDLFATNPFDILFPAIVYHPSNDILLQSFDLDFLFHYGDLIENTIYVCLYSDVNTFIKNRNNNNILDITDEILDIYFPYHEDNDNNANKTENKYFWEEQSLIDTVYNIGLKLSNNPPNFTYKSVGISSFSFIIHPENTSNLPLEIIFKNIHASLQIPMIQYNPGLRREKLYRLYYEQISQNGNKIPFLKKTTIDKLIDKPGKIANITMFVLYNDVNIHQFIQVSFEFNGNISIKGELEQPMMPDKLNEWLKIMINPAIQAMNSFTQSSGFFIRAFDNIQEDYIEIVSLEYNSILSNLKKKMDLEKYMGLFFPFFYNEIIGDKKDRKDDGIYKRYKRIEYFQRMNPHEEFISELLRVTQNKKMIQNELWKRFRNDNDPKLIISFEKAGELLDLYADKHRNVMIPSRYTNTKIEMLEHTGFRTVFHKSDFDNEWIIQIKDITRLEYIYLLQFYLDILFQINQNPELIPKDMWKKYERKRIVSTPTVPAFIPPQIVVPMFTEEKESTGIIVAEKEGNNGTGVEEVEGVEEEDDDDYEFEITEQYADDDDDDDDEDNSKKEKKGGKKQKTKTTKKKKDEEEEDEAEEEEEEDEEDEEEEDEANVKNKQLKTMSNYFIRRIKKRNPLFSKSGFARACPANDKRHPIILTQQEKQKIDEEFTDPKNKPYGFSLKYGTDNNKDPLYYVCPEYWCVKPGQEGPLTQDQVDNKKCGEIIQDSKKIKPGEYTYKWGEGFNDPGVVNRKIKKDMKLDPTTGKDICYPCCFKEWHGKPQKEKYFKEHCLPPVEDQPGKPKKEKKINPVIPNNVRNILGINYTPLPYSRIGLLQFPIQLFLNATTSNICIDTSNKPKLNCPILVRYGAVQTKYNDQYFLGCLADIYAYQHKIQNKIITIPEIREILCKVITLDKFVQLHNATLVSLFRYRNDDFLTADENYTINVYNYENTELYKRLLGNKSITLDEMHLDFFKSTILSYENFLVFLRDETIVVDYTYLWEIICEKNPLLLPHGLNLTILEITNHDITNNVDIICPTSVYNFQLYDKHKETLILIKQNEIYEPIYLYEITSLNPEIISYKKTFLSSASSNSKDITGLNVILKMVESWTLTCKPSQKKNIVQNITLDKILLILRELKETKNENYILKYQILNYQNKIIGIILHLTTDFFLPVFPSAAMKGIKTKWMDDLHIWNNYKTTIQCLKELYLKSDKRILCNPLVRVIEDQKIVGILTMTNQFIQILPYEDNMEFNDGLTNMDDTNYIVADMNIFSQNKKQNQTQQINLSELSPKEKIVQYIKLENQFYAAFRNTIRLQLNLYKSRKTREEIQDLIFNNNMTFVAKLRKMKDILSELMKGYFSFQEYNDDVLSNIRTIFACQADNCLSEPYCLLMGENDKCQFIIPRFNLINKSENENIYYTKMADELIRYKRIRLFMLYPDNYLHISNTEYNIQENTEFIIPKSELNKDYFNHLEPYPLSKYVNTSTFETAIPKNVTEYNNTRESWIDKYKEVKHAE